MSKPTESVWVRRIILMTIKNKLKMTSLDEHILAVEKAKHHPTGFNILDGEYTSLTIDAWLVKTLK